MKVRVLSLVLSLAALQWAGPVQAQVAKPKPDDVRRSAVEAEQELARQFTEFQKSLTSLKNRLDRSSDPSDKDRASQLQKVLDKADSAGIRVKFARLQEHLKKPQAFTLDDFQEAALQTEILARDFAELVDLFEGRNNKLAEEIDLAKKTIKALEDIIKNQKNVQAQTEQGKMDKDNLAKQQDNVTQDTKILKENLTGKKEPKDPKSSDGGETKDIKSQPKEGKGDQKTEARDAGKKNQGEAKDKGPDAKDPKGGEPKAKGADGEKKPGTPDPKAGEKKDSSKDGPKGSDNKEPSAKDSKGSKGAQADPKDSKGKEAKGGEPKEGKSKDAGKKDGGDPKAKETGEAKGKQDQPKNETAKQGDPKAKDKGDDKENKAGAKDAGKDSKSPDAKQADSKDAGKDSKQAEAKGGDPKSGQKSTSKGQPMDPKDGGQPPQAKGDNSDKKDNQPPPPPQAGNEKDPKVGPKQIQDAIDKMREATKDIKDGKNPDAADKQEEAIKKLEIAKKELEKRLLQLREEELERLLANLKTRLERMLAMQRDVLSNQVDGTIATHQAILTNADKKTNDANVQASLRLAAKEKDIVHECTKTLEILEGEGSAVAFPVALQQVREDMKQVQRLLDGSKVDTFTQDVEKDIIESLEEMIKAVEKKKDEMDKKKDKDKNKDPKDPKESGPPPDQKLLDQIAELKMIRSMQIQLNKRTESYARQFPGQEQPNDPVIRRGIDALRDRQDRIFDITNKIQKGDNK